MNKIYYNSPIENISPKSVFLAGPTVRSHQSHLSSWRKLAIAEFEKQGFMGTLFVPEFDNKESTELDVIDIVNWEWDFLNKAKTILFWVPRTPELIGLTTNWEHGFWMGSDKSKMEYGRPDESYRNHYLDIMWKKLSTKPVYNTLESIVAAVVAKSDVEETDSKIPEPYARVVDRLQKFFPDMVFRCEMGWSDPNGKRYWKIFCNDQEIWNGGTDLFYGELAQNLKGTDMETEVCRYIIYDIYKHVLHKDAPSYALVIPY